MLIDLLIHHYLSINQLINQWINQIYLCICKITKYNPV